MIKLLLTNLKHFFITFTLLSIVIIAIGVNLGADVDYGDNPLAYKMDKEGPHIFFENENLVLNYIRGNRKEGFHIDQKIYPQDTSFPATVNFILEDSEFEFMVNPTITQPASVYNDNNPILAISDVESSFKTFRDFLLANKVIDLKLNWIFKKGHLVLVGDFVDRGFSTTQVLWFIYKLEQEAKRHGGNVHFILGNHEIKNLQGNFQKAAFKYLHVASFFGKQQSELYGPDSFLGRWMASKNSLEMINGHLFVHGGIHPKISEFDYSIDEINQIVRDNYRKPSFPKPDPSNEDLLLSRKNGPSWYRGYFQGELSQQDVEKGLDKFGAKDVIVGHTPQSKVSKKFNSKVFAIDVKHPRDYRGSFPFRSSEGLLIDNDKYYRVLDDGTKELL
ncbi:MAG: metallophosphoesterase [Alteromonadaceae bacterium]|nr:metallophosphoesterase [Alteromonadaceae bacterium]